MVLLDRTHRSPRQLSFLFFVCLCLLGWQATAQQSVEGSVLPVKKTISGYVPGRVLLKFSAGIQPKFTPSANGLKCDVGSVNSIVKGFGAVKAQRIMTGASNPKTNQVFIIDFPASANVEQLVSAFKQAQGVDLAEPDYLVGVNTTSPNDPYYYRQWGSYNTGAYTFSGVPSVAGADMDMRYAWDLSTGSSSIIVAVIDAGIKLDHPEFSGRIWSNSGEIAGNGIDDDGNGFIDDTQGWDFFNSDNDPTDDNGHGTNVAGIIGANGNNSIGYAGVDWNCKIMALKSLGASGSGSSSGSISGVYYATDKGAKVVNMSLGGAGSSTLFQDAIDYAYSKGVTVVAAMGNDNTSTPSYPAAYNHVIAVGATRCDDQRASFSNYGSHISVVAPGEAIFGLSYLSNTDYNTGMSGTSQATPHVSGVVALMLALDPSKTPAQIKTILEATAEDMVGLSTEDVAGFDIYYGHGRVNAYQALLYCTTPNSITGTTTVCAGGTTTLASTTTGGTWSSSNTGITSVSSSGVVTGVAAGTATITYFKSACYVTKKVTVKPLPSSVSISPSSGSICLGATTSFTASATANAVTLLDEDWNSGLLNGWSIANTGGTFDSRWQIRASPGWGGNVTGDGTNMMEAVPYTTSSNTNTILTSPAFATTGYTTCSLTYNQKFYYGAGDVTVAVQYSINGGSTWTTVVNQLGIGDYPSTWTASTPQISIALPAAATNAASVLIRWNYNSTSGGIWAIDNIKVTGTSGLTYAWTGVSGATGIACSSCASTSVTPTATGTNTYSVAITANGCTAGSSAAASVSSSLSVSAGSGVTICNGSSTTLTATGATTYTWAPGTGLSATTGASITATPTTTTTYTVTGTTGGCSATATKTVTVNSLPSVSAGSGVAICNGSSTTLTATGAATYTWTPGTGLSTTAGASVVATPTTTTTYTVTGTTSGCSATATKTVTVNSLPSVSAGSGVAICNGSSTTLTATGATTYTWTPGTGLSTTAGASVVATPTTTTTYTVTGTTSGCSATATKTVTVNSLPSVSAGSGVAICNGSSATLTAAGATTYTWTPGTGLSTTAGASVVATPTTTTTYTVTGTTSGCSATATKTVTVNSLPSVSAGSGVTICNGSSTTLTATGATTYTWTPGTGLSTTAGASVVATPTTTTTYTVTGTTGGCSATATKTVTVNSLPSVSTGSGVTICNGSFTTLTATGATTYTWAPGTGLSTTVGASVVATPTTTTTYTVTGTTSGCSATATKTVTVNSLPVISSGGPYSICSGGSVTLTVSGASSYSWTPASGLSSTTGASVVASPASTIVYTVTGTTSGCSATTTVAVTVGSALTVSAGSGLTLCSGNSGNLTASGATDYTWTPATGLSASTGASVTANPSGTTTYTVTGTSGSCSGVGYVTVTVNSVPTVNVSASSTICAGNNTSLVASGATTYSWSPSTGLSATSGSSVTASPTSSTTYTVIGISAGCSGVASTTVTVQSIPTIALTGVASICSGSSDTITASGATTYNWSPSTGLSSATGATVIVSPTATATYTVNGTTSGCTGSTSFTVTVNSLPSVGGILGDSTVNVSSMLTLSNATSGGVWSSSNPSVASVGSTGTVTGVSSGSATISYQVSNSCGTATATKNVTVVNIADALIFDGVDDKVTIGTVVSTGSYTKEAWIYPTSVGGSQNIISSSSSPFWVTGGYLNAGQAGSYSIVVDPTPVVANTWMHVAVAYDATAHTMKLYRNGSLVATASSVTSGAPLETSFIGSHQGTTSFFAGKIDEVRIWNVVRTCDEISAYKGCELTGSESGLVAYYKFNQGNAGASNPSVTTLTDATANHNDGTLSGFALTGSSSNWVSGGGVVSGVSCGSGGFPIVSVSGNGVSITSGSTGVSSTNNTDFGVLTIGSTTSKSFVIHNTGTGTLNLSGSPIVSVSGSSAYSVTATPASSIAAGDSSAFTVSIAPSVTGTFTATISFANNTCGTSPYSFSVSGVASCAAPSVPVATSSLGTICSGGASVLSIVSGSLNDATTWSWYSGSCGGASAGTGTSISVSPASTTTYFVRGTGGCVTPGTCASVTVTVNNSPVISAISNTGPICEYNNLSLSASITGGATPLVYSWSGPLSFSSTSLSVTIDSATAGYSGTYHLTVTDINGCSATDTTDAVVISSLVPITGATNVCVGSTGTLVHPVSGGVWTSSNTAKATINASTGVVTGVSTGTTIVTYTVGSGCFTTVTVNVNTVPLAIYGTREVCEGSNTTLINTATGGGWTTLDTLVASVNMVSGSVHGIAAGTASITYTLVGCSTSAVVTVNSVPASITGTSAVCVGNATNLACVTGGGVWTSNNTTVASIDASGIVSGVSAGTATVSYTASGCSSTQVVTVGTTPAAISGTAVICAGGSSTLVSGTETGAWQSSNVSVASIGSTSGVLVGISAGTSAITFTNAGGCTATAVVSVDAAPGASSGTSSLCIGGSVTYTNATSGGTWLSSNSSVVSILSATGVATGVSAGTAIITYQVSSVCFVTSVVTVNSSLADITGTPKACIGQTTALSHIATGGTWSSSNVARATVDASGIVTGVSAGTVIITYNIGSGCYKTIMVTVNSLPLAIGGTTVFCEGVTATLIDYTAGGTWTSSNELVATIGTGTGRVTGVSGGTATITYQIVSSGCYVTKDVTVNALPDSIAGTTSICAGYTSTLSSSPSGGTWTSSSTYYATIGASTGIVTGINFGTARISYTLSTGCRRFVTVNVGAMPATISGTTVICNGSTTTLTNTTTGGTWSSGNATIASIGSTGVIMGLSEGTAIISYTHGTSGCVRTAIVTVNAALTSNTGGNIVCIGQTTDLDNSTSGGTWTSGNTSRAIINSSTGLVTGVGAGEVVITYRRTAACYSVSLMTVNPLPATITGGTSVCIGSAITLMHEVSGGTWVSSNTTRATVDAETGVVTGVSVGSLNITYFVGGCYRTQSVFVNSLPTVIYGPSSTSVGSSVTLTCYPAGGAWASSDPSVATVTTGLVTGIAAGTTVISYTSYTGCSSTLDFSVMASRDGAVVGVDTHDEEVFIYPNPTNGNINIRTTLSGVLSVYSVDGREVAHYDVASGVSALVLPSVLSNGTYLCRFVHDNGTVATLTIILQN